MRIALIGDVHANVHALESVLADAAARHADMIWNTGDFVGIGAFPDEVVQLLIDKKAVSIAGNVDVEALNFPRKTEEWAAAQEPEELAAFKFAYEHLSPASREYLAALPATRRLEVDGRKVLLCHGSPASQDEHLYADTPDKRFEELAQMADAEIVIFGHSHQPFVKDVAGVKFINTGSVGRPDDGDPRACYAVFDIRTSEQAPFKLKHHRVEYPVQEAADAVRERGLPEALAEVLLEGRSLKWVLKHRRKEAEDDAAKTAKYAARVKDVATAASVFNHEQEHVDHVTELALSLFDQMEDATELGRKERFWLECAALLHDIGWVQGRQAHHKTALKMILEDQTLPLDDRERLIVGSIARYHRRALPSKSHEHFADLKRKDRDAVLLLAGFLRLADGLDRTHQKRVLSVICRATRKYVHLRLSTEGDAQPEREYALEKGKLLEQALNRKLKIEVMAP
ncbi:MAG TPA: YfcE family phosphodiesterase [bacterium]|jgi:putative phosphoesterase